MSKFVNETHCWVTQGHFICLVVPATVPTGVCSQFTCWWWYNRESLETNTNSPSLMSDQASYKLPLQSLRGKSSLAVSVMVKKKFQGHSWLLLLDVHNRKKCTLSSWSFGNVNFSYIFTTDSYLKAINQMGDLWCQSAIGSTVICYVYFIPENKLMHWETENLWFPIKKNSLSFSMQFVKYKIMNHIDLKRLPIFLRKEAFRYL